MKYGHAFCLLAFRPAALVLLFFDEISSLFSLSLSLSLYFSLSIPLSLFESAHTGKIHTDVTATITDVPIVQS